MKTHKMHNFLQEFKKFVAKGNIFDMAVGLILATAFNKIVSSLVNDILMPLFTFAIGAESLADLTFVFQGKRATLTWHYGLFLQAILNFLVIALSLFLIVKIIANSQKKIKEFNTMLCALSKKEQREQIKALKRRAKQENIPFKELFAKLQQEVADRERQNAATQQQQQQQEKMGEQAKIEPNACKNNNTPQTLQVELLQEIRDILKEQKQDTADLERK